MTVIVVNAGEEAFLDLILAVNYTLRLYTNDVTAGLTETQIDALTVASFTEATFAGYAAAALTGGSWTTTPDTPSVGSYAAQTFTRSSTGTTQTVRGYYMTRTSDNALRLFESFESPFNVTNSGDAVVVTPRLTLDDVGVDEVHNAGDIIMTGRSTAPTGWLLCDGTAVSRTTYATLFAAIGTAYGVGDGSTTFNLPDMRQRFALGKAASGTGATLGGTGGTIDHVHDLDTSTSHAKIVIVTTAGTELRNRRRTGVTSWTDTHTASITDGGGGNANTVATELGGSSGTANAPFQTVNYIVKT